MASPSGLVHFITGAASGLGKGTLIHLLKQGARGVYCFDMQALQPDLQEGEKVGSFQGDVRDEANVQEALENCHRKFGRIDTVVNCAGVSVAFRVFNFRQNRPHSLKDFQTVLDINVGGTFNVNRLACPYLYKNEPDEENKQRGIIINTSSVTAYDGQIGQVAFSASAGAINSMTLPLARDLGGIGIRVLTIAVGYFDTPLLSYLPQNLLDFLKMTTLCPKRLGKPEDFAKLVQAIIENPYLNGTVIRLDGGMRALV